MRKELKPSAKNILLEMVSRYEISHGAKLEDDEIDSWDISSSLKALLTIALATSCCFLMSQVGLKSWNKDVLVVIIIVTAFVTIVSFIKNLIDKDFSSLKIFLNVLVLNKIKRTYYKLRRFFKLKNNLKFEKELKENYSEIKNWCMENDRLSDLQKLIKEMQFPSHGDSPLSVNDFVELLKENEKEYSPNFIEVDDLEKMALDGESKSLFFEKNK